MAQRELLATRTFFKDNMTDYSATAERLEKKMSLPGETLLAEKKGAPI